MLYSVEGTLYMISHGVPKVAGSTIIENDIQQTEMIQKWFTIIC